MDAEHANRRGPAIPHIQSDNYRDTAWGLLLADVYKMYDGHQSEAGLFDHARRKTQRKRASAEKALVGGNPHIAHSPADKRTIARSRLESYEGRDRSLPNMTEQQGQGRESRDPNQEAPGY